METITFKNDKVIVTFYPKMEYQKEYFYFRDLTDHYNETSGYTKKVRGIKNALEYIKGMFDSEVKEELKFKHIREVLDTKFGLNVHTYCAMD